MQSAKKKKKISRITLEKYIHKILRSENVVNILKQASMLHKMICLLYCVKYIGW